MRRKSSVWAFLLTMFLAVGAAVAILPGCGDDQDEPIGGGSDSGPVDPTNGAAD